MLDWFEENNQLIIVMGLPNPCRSLESFMSDHKEGLNETLARDIMRQAVTAAEFSIARCVCHCSLTMSNVLIDTEKLQIKFIGFTCSKLISARKKPDDIYCDRAHAVAHTVLGLGKLLRDLVRGHHIKLDGLRLSEGKRTALTKNNC
ncbi:serine/threonine-protein kinase pim-2-like [Triplophysa rosa]|uniref:serine/threonine-protein kinase pim-2-like n=1 Tax=Triplophysa rosa TaxID=992332 RepID=UPI002545F040|nr:serine/threonine-protein kinase pim-2-like [Triplophysa rosa]